MIRLRRVYEAPGEADGLRVLVDRLWPRGLRGEDARIDLWLKEIAPSNALRRWFGHDPAKWDEFKRRYFAELAARTEGLTTLRHRAHEGDLTLLFAAKDTRFNNAAALAEYLAGPASGPDPHSRPKTAMTETATPEKKLFVLDTNVLMHDPACLFRFQEHDLFIPMIVLEELDHSKKGLSEVSRNARQASRFLDELIRHADLSAIRGGIPLSQLEYAGRIDQRSSGRLFFQVRRMDSSLPESLPGDLPDNSILATTLALSREYPDLQVVLVSKDINMRIKASVLGIVAEDYHSDQVLDDINLLYSGAQELPLDFWETHGSKMDSWKDQTGRTFYRVAGPLVKDWYTNQFLYLSDESGFEAIVRKRDNGGAVIELARDFRAPQHAVWGVQARNREQNFAFNVLLDPEIDFVTLLGTAGTGKTLLTLAAGLVQTMEAKIYKEIVMTRETIPLGEDIGFLPGTEEEKMTPWMGALLDNLELLSSHENGNGGAWERQATNQLLLNRIKMRSLNFMRGRTFLSRYIILDEAQNLTSKQMKTLITRAGPGTKVVCLGNIAQIDTPYLTGTTSGLTYVVDHFKHWPHAAHITLKRGERSRLADFAADTL